MARPIKMGVDYFSFDVDFFSDKKIKVLKSRYGADGITIYLYLLCEIYKNGYYLKIDDDFEFIISDDLNMNCEKVKQVLNFLLERSLFDNTLFQSDKVLTSAGIQRRFQLMVKTRAKKNPIIIKDFWILSEEDTEPFIKVNRFLNNSSNQNGFSENNNEDSKKNDIKESKVKKSKGKENKEKETGERGVLPDAFSNPELEDAFQLFITCRKNNGQRLGNEQILILRQELMRLGKDDTERIEIANKAIVSGWKSFYPIKKPSRETDGKKGNSNNYPHRDYNYDAIRASMFDQ